MNVNAMFPNRFLTGKLLPRPILASIVGIEREKLRPAPNKPEIDSFVLVFDNVDAAGNHVTLPGLEATGGHYKLVLRATLAQQVAEILGADDTDAWRGRQIVLFAEQITVAGENMQTVRARAPRAAPPTTTTPAPGGNGKMPQAAAIPPATTPA